MTDRNEVIETIEICYGAGHNCTECRRFSEDGCNDKLMQDVIALIREQEAVMPYIGHGTNGDLSIRIRCGACHKRIDRDDAYCKHCGRAVKWNT